MAHFFGTPCFYWIIRYLVKRRSQIHLAKWVRREHTSSERRDSVVNVDQQLSCIAVDSASAYRVTKKLKMALDFGAKVTREVHFIIVSEPNLRRSKSQLNPFNRFDTIYPRI